MNKKYRTKKILNVGSGTRFIKNSISIDKVNLPGVDIIHDLNNIPWPFDDESFDFIYMKDIIEHLNDTIKIMEEVHRLLRPDGKVKIIVTYWNHKYSFSDPTHLHYFTEVSWDFFTGKRRNYYTKALFKMEKFAFAYDEKVRKLFRSEKLMKFLAKYLCNIITGMYVLLIKV